jgi:hypothetical protein
MIRRARSALSSPAVGEETKDFSDAPSLRNTVAPEPGPPADPSHEAIIARLHERLDQRFRVGPADHAVNWWDLSAAVALLERRGVMP